jgi:hypothetical protein
MITYNDVILKRHKFLIKENLKLNSISVLVGGLEYNVSEVISENGIYYFVFNDGKYLLGRYRRDKFLSECADKFEIV